MKVEELRLQQATEASSPHGSVRKMGACNGFNVARSIKLVPLFNEEDVNTYYRMFEKVVGRLGWPE